MRKLLALRLSVFALLNFMAIVVHAAALGASVIRFVLQDQPKSGEFKPAYVEVTGIISDESPRLLKAALEEARRMTNSRTLGGSPAIFVYLNSPGGSVVAALQMGRLIRAFGAETWIRPGRVCASSCVFVLAGGVDRLVFDNAHIYIHRPFFDPTYFAGLSQADAQKRYNALTNMVRAYMSEMGIADELTIRMLRVSSNKAEELSEQEAKRYSLLGADPAFSEWDRARAGEKYRPEFIEWNDCLLDGRPEDVCAKILRQAK